MPLPIAGAMTAAASLGRMIGPAMQTAMTAAKGSRLAPAFQQLASKLRTFDPATLASLMQAVATKPADTARPPQALPRPPGGALAAALRDAVPPRPTPPPPKPATHPPVAMPPPSPRPSVDGTVHAGGELTPLLARAWDHLETTLRGLTTAVVGGRAIGEEMLAIIGPRLRALNDELGPLLHAAMRPPGGDTAAAPEKPAGHATPAAPSAEAKPAAAAKPATEAKPAGEAGPKPAAHEDSAAAAELQHALQEMGEHNALDLVGAQPTPGGPQPGHAHAHADAAGPEAHAPAPPGDAPAKPAAAPPPGAAQPGVRS